MAPTSAQVQAVRRLTAAAGSGARVSWDERFGTSRIRRSGGYLTAARTGTPVDIAARGSTPTVRRSA
ncbi:MAG: hypothetical protein M3Q27_07460 [Actinomycetota bacterium]|nr:hypothetical protein [Actinomycetota bacterium]